MWAGQYVVPSLRWWNMGWSDKSKHKPGSGPTDTHKGPDDSKTDVKVDGNEEAGMKTDWTEQYDAL